ncbi:hypothetical protein [Thiohalocapsa marina]|uniref:hypothetical protein n=1 Tax=Thiohalocapsa marina TaxID=424902 RepID=UPI0036D92A63
MAAAEPLRIQVRVCAQLHPELYAMLAPIALRGRADRLRQLALFALARQQSTATGAAGAVPETGVAAPALEGGDAMLLAQRSHLLTVLHVPD